MRLAFFLLLATVSVVTSQSADQQDPAGTVVHPTPSQQQRGEDKVLLTSGSSGTDETTMDNKSVVKEEEATIAAASSSSASLSLEDDDESPSLTPAQQPPSNQQQQQQVAVEESAEVIPPLDYDKWVEDTVKKTLGANGAENGGEVLDASSNKGEGTEDTYREQHVQELNAEQKRQHTDPTSTENLSFLAKAMAVQSKLDEVDRQLGVERAKLHHVHHVNLSAVVAARNKRFSKLPAFWFHSINSGIGRSYFPKPDPLDVQEARDLLKLDASRLADGKQALYPDGRGTKVMEEIRAAEEKKKEKKTGDTLVTDQAIFASFLSNVQCFRIPGETSAKAAEARALHEQSILGRGRKHNNDKKKKALQEDELPDWVHRTIVVSDDDDDGVEDVNVEGKLNKDEAKDGSTETTKKNSKTVEEEEVLLPAEYQHEVTDLNAHRSQDSDRYRLVFDFSDTPTTPSKKPVNWYRKAADKTVHWVNELVDTDLEEEDLIPTDFGVLPTSTAASKESAIKAEDKTGKKQKKWNTQEENLVHFPFKKTQLVKDVAMSHAHLFNDVEVNVDPETGAPVQQWRNSGLGQGTKLRFIPTTAESDLKQGVRLVNETLFRIFLPDEDIVALSDHEQQSTRSQLQALLNLFCINGNVNFLSRYETDLAIRKFDQDLRQRMREQRAHAARIERVARDYHNPVANNEAKKVELKQEEQDEPADL